MTTIRLIRRSHLSRIIRASEPDWAAPNRTPRQPKDHYGLFLTKEGGRWVACDNTTGECWVEDFKTGREAVKWLCQA
jgi:hypothetical protein